MRVSIYATEGLLAHDFTRRQSAGLLEKVNRFLAAKAGVKSNNRGVRGNTVAADNIIEALLSRDAANIYSIVGHPWHIEQMATRYASKYKVDVYSLMEWASTNGNNDCRECGIWFVPLMGMNSVEGPE